MTTTTSTTRRTAGKSNGSAAASSPVPHLSVNERVERGKAARAEVPRASHATFEPLADAR